MTVSLAVGALLVARHPKSPAPETASANASGERGGAAAVDKKPLPDPIKAPRIVVVKSERRLMLYSGGELLRTYAVGLGFSPEGDKIRQGDGRTPEGEFYVCSKNDKSKYYLSLGLSYPNEEDAARGLSAGLIGRADRDRIVSAIRARRVPPWNTPLGGEIFIHGHGSASDWTLGCVALENEEMRELFFAVPRGTPVRIEP
jgi:murein L,D-transpeptidase YafK